VSVEEKQENIVRSLPGWVSHLRNVILGLVLILFTGLYFYMATHLVGQTNPNRQKHDQQNNIEHTKIAAEHKQPDREIGFADSLWRWFPHYTDGVVNPLWPWVAARAHDTDETDEEIFVRGKWTNIWITAVFCIALTLVASRYFSLGATINLLLLVGFGAMLPRAPYFQPEPLYYILFFLSWLCCLGLLKKNSIWRYCLLGVLTGLAYMAKTSVQPLLLAFVAVSSYRFLFGALPGIFRKKYNRPASEWCWQTHIIGLVFLAACFLMTAGPRLSYANQKYGNPFHTYPSYWMWEDDFQAGLDFMQEHPDKSTLRRIPSDEVPSGSNYVKDHTPEQVENRMTEGFWWVTKNFFAPKHVSKKKRTKEPWRQILAARGYYLGALIGLIAILAIWHKLHRPRAELAVHKLQPEWSSCALFIIGTTIFYALSYGWYVPIGKGDRFMMSLFAPIVFSLIWASEGLLARFRARGGSPARVISFQVFYHLAHVAIALAIVVRIIRLLLYPEFYGR